MKEKNEPEDEIISLVSRTFRWLRSHVHVHVCIGRKANVEACRARVAAKNAGNPTCPHPSLARTASGRYICECGKTFGTARAFPRESLGKDGLPIPPPPKDLESKA